MPISEFSFVHADGRGYRRSVYWDDLFVFLPRDVQLLVAARVVPNNDLPFAAYIALRSGSAGDLRRALLSQPPSEPPAVSDALVEVITDLAPHRDEDAATPLIKSLTGALEEAAERALVQSAMDSHLAAAGLSPSTSTPRAHDSPASTGALGELADIRVEDVAWIQLSNMVYGELIAQIDAWSRSATNSSDLPSRSGELDLRIHDQLYGNPELLRFIQRGIRARASFASPLIRHFVGYFLRALHRKAADASADDAMELSCIDERIDRAVGHAEAEATGSLPYHEMVVLGDVAQGSVLSDPDDQVHVRRYFHADAASAIDNAMLSEETLRSRRIRLKGYVRHYFRGNVKRVVFVDELPHVRAEQQEGEDTEETRSQISPPSPALPSPRSGG